MFLVRERREGWKKRKNLKIYQWEKKKIKSKSLANENKCKILFLPYSLSITIIIIIIDTDPSINQSKLNVEYYIAAGQGIYAFVF